MRVVSGSVSVALPNGAATTRTSGHDLSASPRSVFMAPAELVVAVPALTAGELPAGNTITFHIEHAAQANFADSVELARVGQVDGSAAGAAAVVFRYKPPTHIRRYVRLACTKTGTSDASTKAAQLDIVV